MRYLEVVEPFYKAQGSTEYFALGFVALLIGVIFLLGTGFLLAQEEALAVLPLFLAFFAFFGGIAAIVHSNQISDQNEARLVAWIQDSYGIELDPIDVSRMEFGFKLPLENGNLIYLDEQKDGGILLYQKVLPDAIRPTSEPVPPVTESSN